MLKMFSIKNIVVVVVVVTTIVFLKLNNSHNGTIHIGLNHWTGYDPLIIAESKDFFKKRGVDVKVERFKSAKEEIQAMKDGLLQGGGFTLDEAVSLHQSGYILKVVLIVDTSFGGDMIIGQAEIKDINMIRDKRVGYEGTLVGEFLLNRALEHNRIKQNEIELVQVNAKDWLTAFRTGQVDVLVCYNPDATILIEHDKANVLFSSKDIPNEIIDVLVFKEEFYQHNKERITKIVAAWFDTLEFIDLDIDAAANIIATEKGVSVNDYKNGLTKLSAPDLEENKKLFNEDSKNNIYKYAQVVIDFMLQKGLMSHRVDTDSFFSQEILGNIKE